MSINKTSLRKRLLTGTAFVAIATALPASAAYAAASIDLDFAATPIVTTDFGSVLAQDNSGPVSATPTGSEVFLSLVSSFAGDVTYSGSYSEVDNSLQATANGNITDATVNLSFTPGLGTDTAATGAFQTNSGTITASSSGDQHLVLLSNSDDSYESTLAGTLTVNNNDISTSATVNDANATIALASGVDATGTVAAAVIAIDETLITTDSATDADMLVSTAQRTTGNAVSTINGTGTDAFGSGSVDVALETVSGAVVVVSNSDIAATAAGNVLAGDITSTDTTATISASAAVTGLQDLVGDVTATNNGTLIRVQTGIDNVSYHNHGEFYDSSITVAGNTVTAGGTGNDSNQTIDLQANQILGAGTVNVSDANTDLAVGGQDVQLSVAGAEQAVTSVQAFDASKTVSSTVQSAEVSLNAQDTNDDVPNSELSVTSNTIQAASTGSVAANELALAAGSTLSAPGAVVAVQSIDGDVTALVDSTTAVINVNVDTNDSTLVVAGNSVRASVTGGSTNNDIAVTADILDLDTSNGGVTITADATAVAAGGDQEIAQVAAGYALVNDQSIGGTLDAGGAANTQLTATNTATRLEIYSGDDSWSSTRHLGGYVDANGVMVEPGNAVTASVTGSTADNAIALSFTNLTGDASTDGEVVAAAANSQVIQGGANLEALVVGDNGVPIRNYVSDDTSGSTITTSYNTVAASAIGNRTTANTVSVSATNVEIGNGILATSEVDLATGDVTAAAGFVAASSQEFQDAAISASQVDAGLSNKIVTHVDFYTITSNVTTAENTLSATATANSADNAVRLGTDATSTIQATSAVANYQDVSSGAISAEIGVLGADAVAAFNAGYGFTTGFTDAAEITSIGGGAYSTDNPLTLTFTGTFTTEEAAYINSINGISGAVAGGNTATWAAGINTDFSAFGALAYNNESDGTNPATTDRLFAASFSSAGSAAQLNNAGVVIEADVGLNSSQLAVTDNTIVGDIKGNTAANTLAVTGTTLTATASNSQPQYDFSGTITQTDTDNALTSVQTIDAASTLVNDVAGSFALDAANDLVVSGSSVTVSGNLQQSYATANTVTNTLALDGTTAGMGSALINYQDVTGPGTANGDGVVTTSDLDVVAIAGVKGSDLALDSNRNQSVATGNQETSTLSVVATNVDSVPGTGHEGGVTVSNTVYGDSFLSSEQYLSNEPTVSATATTDVYNSDLADAGAQILTGSTASFSANQTIAQATGNTSTLDANFGDGSTASYDANGIVYGEQGTDGGAAVTATTNTEVVFDLNADDSTVGSTILSSTLAVDANTATATARGNVGVITLDVTAANSSVDVGVDASVDATSAQSANAGFLAYRYQSGNANVSADSSATTYSIDATQAAATTTTDAVVEASTVSLSGNISSATAVSNTSTSTMRVGGDAMANLDAAAALVTDQEADGAVNATGGITVTATLDGSASAGADAITGSSVSVDGNISSASATGNSASASLSANAANVIAGSGNAASIETGADNTDAAFALVTAQHNDAGITSTNTANLFSLSATGTDLDAVDGSTLSLSSNTVSAYATGNSAGNSAANALTLGGAGASTVESSAALQNDQISHGDVTASASGTFQVDVATTGGSALNAGTASLMDNSTLAVARGNLATNSLTIGATSTTTGGGAGDFGSTAANTLTAAFGLLNEQSNSAAIQASSTGTRYEAVLNGDSGAGIAGTGSTVTVGGNTITSAAYGNIATNSLMLTSLNSAADDASAMTVSLQTNSGSVLSNVTGGFAGVTANGQMVNSTVSVRGNTFSANAVGNFATSVMTRN